MFKIPVLISLFLSLAFFAFAQPGNGKTICIGFYNMENLFDTIDDPKTQDEDFLPNSAYHYSTAVYKEKLDHLAEVVYSLGKDDCKEGVAVLGVSEIENDRVLHDLVSQPALDSFHFKFVHYDSPDDRGIDVALIYNPQYFKVLHSQPLLVSLKNEDGTPRHTRDILWVYGTLAGEPVHILVNHWPSRWGGKDATENYRAVTSGICKHLVDSLMQIDATTKIILMGDLNDDPVDSGVTQILNAKGNVDSVQPNGLYNPFYKLFKNGGGTLEYQDNWNLFDQIIFSYPYLPEKQSGFYFSEAHIFNKDFLITHSGRHKGYPHRTYAGTYYIHGYSDHFPVYAILKKEIE